MSALSISGLHRFFTRRVRILCKLEAALAIITVTYLHNWLFRLILRISRTQRALMPNSVSFCLRCALWELLAVCLARGFYILLSDASGTLIDHWRSLLRFAFADAKKSPVAARMRQAAATAGLGFCHRQNSCCSQQHTHSAGAIVSIGNTFIILSLDVWIGNEIFY